MQHYSLIQNHYLRPNDHTTHDYISDRQLTLKDLTERLGINIDPDKAYSATQQDGYRNENPEQSTIFEPTHGRDLEQSRSYIRNIINNYQGRTVIFLTEENSAHVPRRIQINNDNRQRQNRNHIEDFILHTLHTILETPQRITVSSIVTEDQHDDLQLNTAIGRQLRHISHNSKRVFLLRTPNIPTPRNPLRIITHENASTLVFQGRDYASLCPALMAQNIKSLAPSINRILNRNEERNEDNQHATLYEAMNTRMRPLIQELTGQAEENTGQEERRRILYNLGMNQNVMDVHIDNTWISLVTPALGTEERIFGSYLLKLKRKRRNESLTNRISIQNLSRRVNGNHHPHVRGQPCLGNSENMMSSAFQQNAIDIGLGFLIAYAGQANTDDAWGRSANQYPRRHHQEHYDGDTPRERIHNGTEHIINDDNNHHDDDNNEDEE